jgi:hypothetical protein
MCTKPHGVLPVSDVVLPLGIISILMSGTVAGSVGLPDTSNPPVIASVELLAEEVLDTVALDRAVYFVKPDTTLEAVAPHIYRVQVNQPNRLKLAQVSGSHQVIVEALSIHHKESITTPTALFVRDDDKFPHLVLLLPDGNGWDAVGSYDMTRARGGSPVWLLSAIHQALVTKLEQRKQ